MRKLFLTFIAVIAFAFTSTAQCDGQSTQMNTECGTFCVTVNIQLTGSLSTDIGNFNATGGTMRRKPTLRELVAAADAVC